MAFTYILRCADGSFYVGSTTDIESRFDEHTRGTDRSYTVTRRPVELVWHYEFERIADAALLERKIKGWRREKKIALIEGRFEDLPGLSRTARPPAGDAAAT